MLTLFCTMFSISEKYQFFIFFSSFTSLIMLSRMFFSSSFQCSRPLMWPCHSSFEDRSFQRIFVITSQKEFQHVKRGLEGWAVQRDCILKKKLLQRSSSSWAYALQVLIILCCYWMILPISATIFLLERSLLSLITSSKSSLHASIALIRSPNSSYSSLTILSSYAMIFFFHSSISSI